MITIIISLIVGIVVAVIAYTIGAVNNTEPLPRCCLECLHEHRHGCNNPFVFGNCCCNHFGINDLRNKVNNQEQIINRLKMEMDSNCKMQSYKIYAPTIKEQEYVDLIIKSQKTIEQVAKDLKLTL